MPVFKFQIHIIPPKRGKRAVLGGSAIPRQPVARAKQASIPWRKSKNQFNIRVRTLPNISDIKLIRTDTTLDLILSCTTMGLSTPTVQWSLDPVLSPHPGRSLQVTRIFRGREPLPHAMKQP